MTKLSKTSYKSALKAMNAIRQTKIDSLHSLKGNRGLTRNMPPSVFSKAVSGIKAAIAEDDKIIADFKQNYQQQRYTPEQKKMISLFTEIRNVIIDSKPYVERATFGPHATTFASDLARRQAKVLAELDRLSQ